MSFDIPIKVDPGNSLSTIRQVEQGLAGVEKRGRDAGASGSRGMRELGAAANAQSAAVNKMNAALDRERQVLERIRGPMNENIADMQALSALYSKGAINAHQYAREVERLRSALLKTNQTTLRAPSGSGGFNAGAIAGSLPGGSIIAGAVGGGVAGAAGAGLQAAIGGAGQIIEIADAYTSLNNRLKSLTGSQEAASTLFGKLSASANKTYSDVNTTTAAFIRMQRSLQGLGVSQDRVLKFTEHLNMQIALSGTDSAGASAALLQLGQALSAGALRGDEFNSIIEQAPALLEPIAQKLGVSTGQLRAMAEQGKLTSQIIFDAYEGNGGAGARIERAFGEAVPTVSQQFQVLKNEAFELVGKFAQDIELGSAVAIVFGKIKDAASIAGAQLKTWIDLYKEGKEHGLDMELVLGGGADNFKKFGDAIGFTNAFTGKAIGLNTILKVALLDATKATKEAADAQQDYAGSIKSTIGEVSGLADKLTQTLASKGFYALVQDPWFVAPETPKKIKATTDAWLDYWRKAAEEEAKIRNRASAGGDPSSVTSPGMITSDTSLDDLLRARNARLAVEDDVNQRAAQAIKDNGKDVEKGLNDLADKNAESAERVREAWAGAAGSIAADLANAFADGEVSADKLLRKAALLALQVTATQMGGSGGAFLSAFAGGLGGGANGFDYLSSGRGLQLPGFATGGDMIMRGSGGTDSQLAMWWMTPGESLHVRTPEQRREAAEESGGGGRRASRGRTQVVVQMQNDRRDLVRQFDSRDGEQVIANIDRRMRRGQRR
jgi:tape measure domain-containing protein